MQHEDFNRSTERGMDTYNNYISQLFSLLSSHSRIGKDEPYIDYFNPAPTIDILYLYVCSMDDAWQITIPV